MGACDRSNAGRTGLILPWLPAALCLAACGLFAGRAEAQGKGARTQEPSPSADHPLQDVMEFAAESREALKEIKDYTAVFTKTEYLDNRREIRQVMDIKVREKPFSVYLRNRSGKENGREVIYVANANNGNLIVHEVGIKAIAGTLSIRPDGPEVMEENRYPVTRIGMSNMLATAYQIWELEKKYSDPAQVDVKYFPDAKLGAKPNEIPCNAVQITHKQPRKELRFQISRLYFDDETKLPIRAERYGWPRRPGDKPPLIEEYTYSNIKTNVGLTNADFDPNNRQYNFR